MTSRPDPSFFAEINRRITQGRELARQDRYADARLSYYSALEYAAERGVTVPISLILDVWRDMVYCDLGLDDFESAGKIVRAAEAILFEWDEHQRAGRNRQPNAPVYKSYELVQALIPGTLAFVIPDNFDPRPDLNQYHTFQKMIDPHLDTVDAIVETLWYFAAFYCGASEEKNGDINWYVVKDWLASFSPNKEHKQYDAGILYISRKPIINLGVALTPEGCWVTLMKEMTLPQINRVALQTVSEGTIPANRRDLWKFLNGWVRQKMLIPAGDRFKVGV